MAWLFLWRPKVEAERHTLMQYFPLFYNMRGKSILVVGGGVAASSKVRLLVKTEAKIAVVAPHINRDLTRFFSAGKILWRPRAFLDDDLLDVDLVYCATANDGINADIAQKARALKIIVSAVDQGDVGDVITPAIVDRDPVVVAVGTEGASPALARRIRARIDDLLPIQVSDYARWSKAQRNLVKSRLPDGRDRRLAWNKLLEQNCPFDDKVSPTQLRQNLVRTLDGVLAIPSREFGHIVIIDTSDGDPELLNMKMRKALDSADQVLVSEQTSEQYLEYARREAVIKPFAYKPGSIQMHVQRWKEDVEKGDLIVVLAHGTHQVKALGGVLLSLNVLFKHGERLAHIPSFTHQSLALVWRVWRSTTSFGRRLLHMRAPTTQLKASLKAQG